MSAQWIEGAFYRYDRAEKWCREGMARAHGPKGSKHFRDTYWRTCGDEHVLTPEEELTLELYFDPADGWREAGDRESVQNYEADDVRTVTSQHGLQLRHWIREGATESDAMKLRNARAEVEAARQKMESAIRSFEWAVRAEVALHEQVQAKADRRAGDRS